MLLACDRNSKQKIEFEKQPKPITQAAPMKQYEGVDLTLKNADELAQLPLDCIQMEYPNKLDHIISSEKDLESPASLHPAFYGCFDWHSSVHGHWSLVRLLKEFPNLSKADEIRKKLNQNISKEHILAEVAYFKQDSHKSAERTYGWAWLLKLAEELHTWDTDYAKELEQNLQPLTDLMVKYYIEFLPKMNNPTRVGEHANTAFALVFAYDYADAVGNEKLKEVVKFQALKFYENDVNCPLSYEPGGSDFLSPCLEEVNIMQRVLPTEDFESWLKKFLPQLYDPNFDLSVGRVSERSDGKLVHLDGLNFSRAWVLYDLAKENKELEHLNQIANKHMQASFEDIINDESYMGSHWLGSFALYALERQEQ